MNEMLYLVHLFLSIVVLIFEVEYIHSAYIHE